METSFRSVGTFLHIEVDKTFLHMNHMRKTSPRTYKMETTGPKVLSRYLSAPTGSRHDHCKCDLVQTPETKPMNPLPKRVPKPPVDRTQIDASNPITRIKKQPSVIPKVTTPSVKNNNVVKDQIIKKDIAAEPRRRDLKLKAKTDNPPSSKTPTRRHSDMFLPNKDMSLPSTKFPKRRLSEININPNKDVASVSKVPLVRSSRINKNESIKDSKLPLVKRSNSVKNMVSTPKVNVKVPTLRTYKSLPKPEVKSSRKSKSTKPVEEVVPKKTLPVIEPNNGVQISISQSQNSLDSCSSSEEKVDTYDQKLQVSSQSIEDDKQVKDGQENDNLEDSEVNDIKQVTGAEITTSQSQNSPDYCSSSEEKGDTHDQIGLKVSSPTMEDDKHVRDGKHNDNLEDSEVNDTKEVTSAEITISQSSSESCSSSEEKVGINDQNELKVSSPSVEDDKPAKDDQQNDNADDTIDVTPVEITINQSQNSPDPCSISEEKVDTDDQSELKVSSPSMEEDIPMKEGNQQNDNAEDSEVNDTDLATCAKLEVETEDGSTDELRFRRGTVISPQSENRSPQKLDFKKGKELDENETENGETTSLRRLSSDGVVSSPEKPSISVDLKHQEVEEKKPVGLINNIIEETASKLIRTRKSKVLALVGAFENIVSSSDPPQTSTSTTRL